MKLKLDKFLYSNSTSHKRSNPKWIAFDLVRIGCQKPTFGWRFLLYLRGNHCFSIGFYIDRRKS